MDQARLAALMSRDPSVQRAMESVFGKSDASTVQEVMTAPASVVVSKLMPLKPPKPPKMPSVSASYTPLPRPNAKSLVPKPMTGIKTKNQVASPAQPVKIPKTVEPVKPPVIKSDDADLVFTTTISKTDEDQRTVFGWASITEVDGAPVIDRQGDMIEMEELSKAAYDYVVSSRKGGHQHQRDASDMPLEVSDMIESVVFTPEKIEKMGLPTTTPLGWWVGYKVRDENIWQSIKKGDITGFSVHGKGKRVPV